MKKLFVITAKVIVGVVGLYAAICLVAMLAGGAVGFYKSYTPAGRAEMARYNAEVAEFNDRASSLSDQN